MIPYEELYEKNGKKERGGGKVGRKEGGEGRQERGRGECRQEGVIEEHWRK